MMKTLERETFAALLLRLRASGRIDPRVIEALESTPRAFFLPKHLANLAWADRVLPIECGEAVESVDLQARIISALDLHPDKRVLEVGTGTGFTAALIARLCARIVSVERYRTLAETARQRIDSLGIANAVVKHADGQAGLAAEGPYDRIVVWGSFESYPRVFVDQLATGGTMVAAIGPAEAEQTLTRMTRQGSRFDLEEVGKARFLPLANGMASKL